jgi:hypothetical protein
MLLHYILLAQAQKPIFMLISLQIRRNLNNLIIDQNLKIKQFTINPNLHIIILVMLREFNF